MTKVPSTLLLISHVLQPASPARVKDRHADLLRRTLSVDTILKLLIRVCLCRLQIFQVLLDPHIALTTRILLLLTTCIEGSIASPRSNTSIMWHSLKSVFSTPISNLGIYLPLPNHPVDEEKELRNNFGVSEPNEAVNPNIVNIWESFRLLSKYMVAVILFVATVVGFVILVLPSLNDGKMGNCQKIAYRREWRSLSNKQKLAYIDAIQCLRSKPSRMGLQHSLYDDFPYVHNRVGLTGQSEPPLIISPFSYYSTSSWNS